MMIKTLHETKHHIQSLKNTSLGQSANTKQVIASIEKQYAVLARYFEALKRHESHFLPVITDINELIHSLSNFYEKVAKTADKQHKKLMEARLHGLSELGKKQHVLTNSGGASAEIIHLQQAVLQLLHLVRCNIVIFNDLDDKNKPTHLFKVLERFLEYLANCNFQLSYRHLWYSEIINEITIDNGIEVTGRKNRNDVLSAEIDRQESILLALTKSHQLMLNIANMVESRCNPQLIKNMVEELAQISEVVKGNIHEHCESCDSISPKDYSASTTTMLSSLDKAFGDFALACEQLSYKALPLHVNQLSTEDAFEMYSREINAKLVKRLKQLVSGISDILDPKGNADVALMAIIKNVRKTVELKELKVGIFPTKTNQNHANLNDKAKKILNTARFIPTGELSIKSDPIENHKRKLDVELKEFSRDIINYFREYSNSDPILLDSISSVIKSFCVQKVYLQEITTKQQLVIASIRSQNAAVLIEQQGYNNALLDRLEKIKTEQSKLGNVHALLSYIKEQGAEHLPVLLSKIVSAAKASEPKNSPSTSISKLRTMSSRAHDDLDVETTASSSSSAFFAKRADAKHKMHTQQNNHSLRHHRS